MPANFPEIWLDRVIENVSRNVAATFLDGIPDLDVKIITVNPDKPTEKNIMYVAVTDFEVEVLINNTTYELDVQQYEDDTVQITLDKYQSLPTGISDDDAMGSSYSKIDTATKAHTNGVLAKKYPKALHSIAPAENTVTTPVLTATGGPDGLTDSTGRKRLTYEDLVEAKSRADKAGFGNLAKRRLVLTDNHWNDLLLDRKNFGNQLVDYAAGKPNPIISGFELHTYPASPLYGSDKKKKPFGAIPVTGDKPASVFFVVDGIAKKVGDTKQYYSAAAGAPRTQSSELSYRHYFVAMPFQNKKIGAIIE